LGNEISRKIAFEIHRPLENRHVSYLFSCKIIKNFNFNENYQKQKLPGVGDGLVVLDHGHGLTGQDGLINSQCGGQDRDNPDIGGDFVTDCNENK